MVTNGRTDGLTDGHTLVVVKSLPRLKRETAVNIPNRMVLHDLTTENLPSKLPCRK